MGEENLHAILIDFEDTIKLEALTFEDAYQVHKTAKNTFIIGAGIQSHKSLLRGLGFKDMWQVTSLDSEDPEFKKFLNRYGKVSDATNYMYAYVDYVLEDTNSNLFVFMPEKSGIIASGEELPSYTSDEIARVLQKMPEYSDRIYFVTGLLFSTAK